MSEEGMVQVWAEGCEDEGSEGKIMGCQKRE